MAPLGLMLLAVQASGPVGAPVPMPVPTASVPTPQAPPPPVADPSAAAEGVARGSTQDADQRYDAVGYASWYGEEVGAAARTASGTPFDPAAITIAHPTLPLGSIVEVTSLDTGRTILAKVTDRGPGRPDRLIDLSRGAAALLGTQGAPLVPVRVRSASAAPADEAALTAGQAASPRLDAPASLLVALRKRLPSIGPAAPTPTASPAITTIAVPASIPPVPDAAPTPQPPPPPAAIAHPKSATPAASPPRTRAPQTGTYLVQVAALSSADRAKALAKRLGGTVLPGGAIWRVRLGPFETQAQAQRARDGAARQGYGDAQIIRTN